MNGILSILPKDIEEKIIAITNGNIKDIEEIRIRVNRPVELLTGTKTVFLPYFVDMSEAEKLISKLGKHSFYTLEEELKRGFITIEGGHRIGLGGKVILENGKVKGIRHVSSFNIRIAKEKIGIGEKWIPFLYDSNWKHTMIIGPPQTGKTTLLRDFARIMSTGSKRWNIPAQKVGIVDERSEIAGCFQGVPQMTFGHRLDVLDACPKAEGMMMMIRSMSPDILVVDEIGRKEDTEAILEAVNAGVRLMMTTHGESFEDIQHRPTLKPILEQKIFQRYFELKRIQGPGKVVSLKDENGREIYGKTGGYK
ncbi:stage III sporulation protein AA [Fervidibacillus halotolerans]|uniref:Stage III sporulation protein AA n=1 Tax=Fervidibacillus halotolerans TaxID=2980027 RepID=A0A9E8RW68_9BACI|nr:stage III sporulation protein AA [Fervidibacillus halotolerans]WAA11430.1 stage III sporulation protein AA [Fervidibacillus halotolerans]